MVGVAGAVVGQQIEKALTRLDMTEGELTLLREGVGDPTPFTD